MTEQDSDMGPCGAGLGATQDTAAWCACARRRSLGRHAVLTGSGAVYDEPIDEVALEKKKVSIPYLEALFVARDIVFRSEVSRLVSAPLGLRQLVSVGAGYDDWYAACFGGRVCVFEVDDEHHIEKRRLLGPDATFVVADANDPLGMSRVLCSAGYQPNIGGVVLLQGLLYYLSVQHTERLLQEIRRLLAGHGYLVLDLQIGGAPSPSILDGMRTSGMSTDFFSMASWLQRLELAGFEALKTINLGHEDPLGDLKPWRHEIVVAVDDHVVRVRSVDERAQYLVVEVLKGRPAFDLDQHQDVRVDGRDGASRVGDGGSAMGSFRSSIQPVQLSRPVAMMRGGLPFLRSSRAPRILRRLRYGLLERAASKPYLARRWSILRLSAGV